MRIGNLDERYQSLDFLTQLAILVKRKDVKEYGLEMIFKPILDDLKLLETNGIEVELNGKKIQLFGTISYFVADNLAANGVSGLVESFSANCKILNYLYFLNILKKALT